METTVDMEKETKEFLVNIHFPEEIIIEILRRLPVRILMQFKLVCKPWNSLISDPTFKLSTKRRQRAIMCTTQITEKFDGTHFDEKRKMLYSLDCELFVQDLPCPVKVPSERYTIQFLGFCNGLLLFCTSGCIYLWNASTRCCRQLHQLNGLMKRSSYHLFGIASGLCFNESSNDYKAMIIDTNPSVEDRSLRVSSFVYVASLRRRIEWTDINFPYKLIRNQRTTLASGALVNGHLHWLVEEGSGNEIVIVYFDETTNQFHKFPMPETTPHEGGFATPFLRLIVLDGCICMCISGSNFRSNDILIMREYGVKESWTTLFRIQGIQGCFVPLFSSVSDDDILVSNAWEIEVYNCKNNSSKKIKLSPDRELLDGYPLVYEETLESVDWVQQD
ncbi:F-box/kelch-repeat protein At3g23880-like [Coffea arabica]|uniref:F-box/kelch-repeat protein At3g23880-like n=1 Tax=Coffea arabica TaxID=13443 RepID=A0A6P6WYN9_COFAR|nr:F-box/kelch-repeat protein At3g23880-like [Coffea arabica]